MPIPFDRFRLLNETKKKIKNVSYRRQEPEQPTVLQILDASGVIILDSIAPGEEKIINLPPEHEEFCLRNEDETPIEIVLDTGLEEAPPSA